MGKFSLFELCKRIIVIISIIVLLILTAMNLVITGYFDANYLEYTRFRMGIFVLTVPATILLFLLVNRLSKTNICNKRFAIVISSVALAFSFLFSLYWAYASKSFLFGDRLEVSNVAVNFLKNDFSDYSKGRYLCWYPFQTGIITIIEFFYKLFGTNPLVIKVVNCFFVILIFGAVLAITSEMSSNNYINIIICAIACSLSFPVMFFVTYVYGNLIGLAFALWAVYFEMRYLKTNNLWNILPAICLISIACIAKNNFYIALISMAICLFLKSLKNRSFIPVCLAICMIIVCSVVSKGFMKINSSHAEVVYDGVPKIMWVQMGLNEGFYGNGTYTSYGKQLYYDSDLDVTTATKQARLDIKERLSYMVDNPIYTIQFFAKKMCIQWTEPTYMSIWESNCQGDASHFETISPIIKNIYYGALHKFFEYLAEIMQVLVFFFALLHLWFVRKNMNLESMILILTVLGGVLFHIFWEAKSQYAIQYYVMLLPYAATGLCSIADKYQAD